MAQNIELLKLETLKDAEYPQEYKYPSNTILAKGFMFNHTQPEVNRAFYIMFDKTSPIFHTSTVKEIIDKTDKYIIFKTLNSLYKILIK